MAQIARLKDAEISNGNLIDADDLDAEFDQLISSFNTNDTELTNIGTGTYTFSGVKTFSSTPKMNAIDERTAGSGVTIDGLLIKDAGIRFTDAGELTIATGAITATGSYHTVDTESDAASDDLDTISGGTAGAFLVLQAENDARSVVVKHNTGNILLANGVDMTLDEDDKTITLIYSAALSKWCEVGRTATVVNAATQAEQETATATDVYVTPGRQQYHPSAAKFWIKFTGTGTIAISTSYNVTSITDNGTGNYTVTIATDFSGADWACFVGCESNDNTGANDRVGTIRNGGQAAGTINVMTADPDAFNTPADATAVHIIGFGDQ